MKPEKYKIKEQLEFTAEEPAATYTIAHSDESAANIGNGLISSDTDTISVDEFIGKVRTALDRRYENLHTIANSYMFSISKVLW